MKNVVFIFDFDGVLVDTIGLLYNAYIDFLKEFGKTGDQEEFNQLNGPKITEIISILRKKYQLNPDESELLIAYNKKLSEIYFNATLNKGVESILRYLREREFKIALASSSKREGIQFVLDKFQLTEYFDFIISGDEVKNAKPSPEIYNIVKEKFPNHEYLVIEDSENGVKSATDAGMKVLFFNPGSGETRMIVAFEIAALGEIEQIAEEVDSNCFTISCARAISLTVSDQNTGIDPTLERIVEDIWRREQRTKNLSNGKIICFRSCKMEGGVLRIECFITEYKYFFARLKHPELGLNVAPVGVSGVIIDKIMNTLVARRNQVAEYEGFLEFMPSGSIDSSREQDGYISFEDQLVIEFEEETGIPRESIDFIEPFCFIFDKTHEVYDICCKIYLKESIKNLPDSVGIKEYSNVRIVDFKNIRKEMDQVGSNWVPVSRILLNNLEKELRR